MSPSIITLCAVGLDFAHTAALKMGGGVRRISYSSGMVSGCQMKNYIHIIFAQKNPMRFLVSRLFAEKRPALSGFALSEND